MIFRDLLSLSTGNLTRMKLRTFLTVAGVVIAIGTFVAMVSFGAGNQKYVADQFEKLGLFSTIQVYPLSKTAAGDTVKARPLDNLALAELTKIPGVRLAYPFDAITVTVALADSQITSRAQALPVSALHTKLFSQMSAGRIYTSDSAREAVVTPRLMHLFHVAQADSLVGQALILTVRASTIDSGLAKLLPDRAYVQSKIKAIQFDSLLVADYRQRQAHALANEAIGRFVDGFFNNRATVVETLTVCGVLEERGSDHMQIGPIILPLAVAQRFKLAGMRDDPANLFSAFSSGTIFSLESAGSGLAFPSVTLDIDPNIAIATISDSVKSLGFRPFSFAERFAELQKFFFYFNLALSVVGLIALITASLGIVNTMVMSIIERRREIGVLKSLGASEGDVRILFLVESSVIGAIGSAIGIIIGWLATRVASTIMQSYMTKEGLGRIELFAMPIWLIATAMAVGIIVSVIAGYYPAARAAAVDPVEALRSE